MLSSSTNSAPASLHALQLGAPRTMSCLFLPSPRPRLSLTLTSPSSCRHPQCRGHLLLPRRRRPWVRLGVRVAGMAGVGVSAEGDAMQLGRSDELRGPSQEANRWAPVEAALNWASKRLLAGSYVFAVFWKHDVEIMWVLLGASANYLLSLILKKMLNHERPAPDLRSDPGMPSSHAQSICYAATLLVLSLYYYLGKNYLTMILGAATLSMATYLSWLRVSRRLHTLNQVVAGAAVGSAFGALWFALWRSLVQDALLASSLSARIVVILGSASSCVGIVVCVSDQWLQSKWLVAGCFAIVALWKHDAEIIWILLGAVTNSLLSVVLKKLLNHERPSALRSDPGMPSSHAQSIFYGATVLVLSLYYWIGTNYMTLILGPAALSMAAYLSWLRVSQRLHTLNQVMVGAGVGSAFGALWFVLWHSLVQEAFASSLLVRIIVILGSSVFSVGFVMYMIRHWLKDE